jgi:hypothetical protein
LNHFVTPWVWRQAQQSAGAPNRKVRWSLQPLVLVLLTMTWCQGGSQEERFETARAFCVACRQKTKRPGETVKGFHKALARVPLPVLRTLAAGVRQRILQCLTPWLTVGPWIPFGCDGTRLECPRTHEPEQRLGQAGKPDSAPTVYVSALVHLATGLLWAWQIGKGTASEHYQLGRLLRTLPAKALLVADAAYLGYELFQTILAVKLSFLFRLSSRAYLYSETTVPLKRFREGIVYYWPGWAQKKGLAPLRLRLLRISGGKVDVWLLTNVLDRSDANGLSRKRAAQFYRWRWRNEGFFRTYKRTLGKVKLTSRTMALLHREVEGSLLAVQILLAHGALALSEGRDAEVMLASPRQLLLVLRQEIQRHIHQYLGRYQHRTYLQRLQEARLETRDRASPKVRRPWPRRKDHRPPKPPKILAMNAKLKAWIQSDLEAA